jgi:GNAT superfamily N-acetyltransferase
MDSIRTTSLVLPFEVREMLDMVTDTFRQSMEAWYSPEGRAVFLKYTSYESTLRRIQTDHRIFVAHENGRPVGMIEFRRGERISLFVVHPSARGKGVGRRLLEAGLMEVSRIYPHLREVQINAPPASSESLAARGFAITGEERLVNGTRIVPMAIKVGDANGQLPTGHSKS